MLARRFLRRLLHRSEIAPFDSYRLGLWLLYANVGLNVFGAASVVLCNVRPAHGPAYCQPFLVYALAAAWAGVPLFLATTALAPAGTLTARQPGGSRYRRLYWTNLALVAVLWGVPALIVAWQA